MTKLKLIIFILFSSLIIYSGCDDSGILPHQDPKGRITISPSNLKTLDVNTDGWYELWIGLDSAGSRVWYSAGDFNVNSSGSPVDLSGNAMAFTYSGDTNNLYLATRSLITIEKQHNVFPSAQRLISGNLITISDSLSCTMNIGGDEAFGTVGSKLIQGDRGLYILQSPSTNNANCFQGIWFCNTLGVPSMPDSIALTNGGGWVYQGWLIDNSTGQYYSIGKFYDPYSKDADTSGSCAGPNPGFNAPGQDWIQTGGGCPSSVLNIRSGNFGVFVSLEPSNEVSGSPADNQPFFFRAFNQHIIDQSIGCGQQDNLFSQNTSFPTARIRIAL